jgi:hypothetical protein
MHRSFSESVHKVIRSKISMQHLILNIAQIMLWCNGNVTALVDAQVVLYRLSWQRVWSIPPAESAVSALAWRPDGRGMYKCHAIFLSTSCAIHCIGFKCTYW